MINLLREGLTLSGLLQFALTMVTLIFSLSFHEYAHAWAANRLGDSTAREAGRMTLNPLVHLDPLGTLMMLSGIVGWAKPVPYNPRRFRPNISLKKGSLYVAAAGPLSNLLLAFVGNVIFNLVIYVPLWISGANLEERSTLGFVLIRFLVNFVRLNLFLAIFNALPVPPLDGYKVFGAFLPHDTYWQIMRYERQIGLVFLMILFLAPNVLSSVLTTIARPLIALLISPIDRLFQWVSLGLL